MRILPSSQLRELRIHLGVCGRVYSFPTRTGHAAHVTFIVAELSYRSLLNAPPHGLTAWLTSAWQHPYGTTSDKTRCTKRDDGSFSSDALGPIDVGTKCHRSAGTSGGFKFVLITARGVLSRVSVWIVVIPGRVIHLCTD